MMVLTTFVWCDNCKEIARAMAYPMKRRINHRIVCTKCGREVSKEILSPTP